MNNRLQITAFLAGICGGLKINDYMTHSTGDNHIARKE